MFKFIHAADIHLDSPLRGLERYEGAPVESVRQASRRALENLVALAVAEQAAFVVIAGDVFDGDWKDYNTGLYFVSQMSRLHESAIPVFILKGNHDAANKLTKSLPMPPNVKIFAHRAPETFVLDHLNVSIHGQSFAAGDIRIDLSQNYPPAQSGKFNIGVLHTCAGGREGHDSYAPCKLDGLLSKNYNYWALGHIHKSEILNENPPVIFPGNIQGRHIRESGAKGCRLVTVDDRFQTKHEFCQLSVMRWENLSINLASARNEDDIFTLVSEALQGAVAEYDGMPLALRIHLTGQTQLDCQLRARRRHFTESIRALGIQRGADSLWIEKIKIKTSGVSESLSEHFDGPLFELVNLIDQLSNDTEALESLKDELSELRQRLPAELPERASLEDSRWIQESLPDIREILLERLTKPGVTK